MMHSEEAILQPGSLPAACAPTRGKTCGRDYVGHAVPCPCVCHVRMMPTRCVCVCVLFSSDANVVADSAIYESIREAPANKYDWVGTYVYNKPCACLYRMNMCARYIQTHTLLGWLVFDRSRGAATAENLASPRQVVYYDHDDIADAVLPTPRTLLACRLLRWSTVG